MSQRRLPLVLVAFPIALLVACAAPASTSEDATLICDANPELSARTLHPNRIAVNGVSSNRIAVNGIQNNRIAVNGVQINRIAVNGVQLNGTELVGVSNEGRAVGGTGFVGTKVPALLSDGRIIDLVIASFESVDGLALYELTYEGENICSEDAKGLFVSGVWDARGARSDSVVIDGETAAFTFSCLTGVIAKCVRWGYAPEKVGPALHQTCTRMARADYCGSGVSFTRDGTAIDMFDVAGVQAPANEPGFLFEAGWNEGGAACVSRPRYDATTASGADVLPSCWATLSSCSTFDEAKGAGALMANLSRPQSRRLCD